MELLPVHFSLQELFDNLCSLNRFTAEAKDLEFRVSFADDVPHIIYGDDVRIRQIITNLLNNAIKYTREGTVDFSVSRGNSASGQDSLIFSVKDTGIGIKEEDFPKLFGNFQQLDGEANRGIVGTGLGLAITKNLVSMMNGGIEFSSEYGKGSMFTVYLPLVEGDADKVQQRILKSRIIASDDTRILVVDDNRINLRVALAFLATHNINAEIAESGAEAVEKAAENIWDIIFMDHMMPGMDGIEATERIRRAEAERGLSPKEQVPIIALTANAVKGSLERFLSAGMNDMVAKPIDAVDLNMKLAKWLRPEKILRFDLSTGRRPETNDSLPGAAFPSPVLDRREGLGNCGGDEDFYKKLCADFVEGHGGDYEKISAALEEGDLPLALRLAHTLKSTAGLIGARTLRRIAYDLENSLRNETSPVDSIKDRAERLRPAMETLLEELRVDFPGEIQNGPAAAPDEGTPVLRGNLVEKLEALLKAGNTESLKLVPDLRAAAGLDRNADILVKQIEDFDFSAALKTLKKIKPRIFGEANDE
jgi:CheY-like chemotaxis protein